MHLSFIGAGYVGLVSGTLLAHLGHEVVCIDNNIEKIKALNKGLVPIYEPGLDKYMLQSINNNRLSFSSSYGNKTDAIFVAVGTPPLPSGEADLTYIYDAVLKCAQNYHKDTLIIIKSTVPPSSCNNLQKFLKDNGYDHEIASNPEFLREGNAIEDFLNPDRIIVGTSSIRASKILEEIYKKLIEKNIKFIQTDKTTAELIKYASNSYLATKIGFINEMANLCENIGADIDVLSEGMGADNRIGADFLKAGPGFGGSCFPKDILALSYLASKMKTPSMILNSVIASNQTRKEYIASRIISSFDSIKNKKICILGITFKAGTDDVRSSPAIEISTILEKAGAKLQIYDPEGMENAKVLLPNVEYCNSAYDAAKEASCLVILTEWEEFRKLDFDKIGNLLDSKTIFDFRNILNKNSLVEKGFEYYKIG